MTEVPWSCSKLGFLVLCLLLISTVVKPCFGKPVYAIWAMEYMHRSPDCLESVVMDINGKFPGPEIRARVGDTIKTTVINKLSTEGLVIHWHVILQLADGVAVRDHDRNNLEKVSVCGVRAIECLLNMESESSPARLWEQNLQWLLAVQSFSAEKYLKKIGLGKEDHYFWKQIGKALLCTYAIFGAAWLYNETSPLGWWTLKPRPKEEKELAHLYERRKFPYPGDEEAMREFVEKGGMIGTTIGPKGVVETDKDSYNYQKQLQDKKFEQEALKLWLRMRNEVVSELQDKGYDVE